MRIVAGAFPLCGAGLTEAYHSRLKGSTRASGKGGWRRKQSGRRVVQASWRHEGRHAPGQHDQCVGDSLDERDGAILSFLAADARPQTMRPSARLVRLEMTVCVPSPGRLSRRRFLDADVAGAGVRSLRWRSAYPSKVGGAGVHSATPPGCFPCLHLSPLGSSGRCHAALHLTIFFHHARSTLPLGVVLR